MSWDDLTVDIRPFEPERLLAEWRWLVGEDLRLVFATALGDLFLLEAAGEVYWLNTADGLYLPVAPSTREFRSALRDRTRILEWFIPDLVTELRAAGMVLGRGQCYSFTVPPFLGGPVAADNVTLARVEDHLAETGRRRRPMVEQGSSA